MLHSRVLPALALAASGLAMAAPHAQAADLCQGKTASIVQTGGTVTGTPGDDVIIANDATVLAGDGNDTICGDTSNTIDAGDGNDSIALGTNNRVTAGEGNDIVGGLRGLDIGDNVVDAGSGDDVLILSGNGNQVTAGDGNDTVHYTRSGGSISTGAGDDDVALGFVPAGPAPAMDLGDGDDTLSLSPGATLGSRVNMGNGNDQVSAQGASSINLSHGAVLNFDGAGYTILFAEKWTLGAYAVTVRGTSLADRYDIAACNATVHALRGDDRVRMLGLPVDGDTLEDHHYCSGDVSKATFYGGLGNDYLLGWRGKDTLIGGSGHDRVDGGNGRDVCDAEREVRCEA